MSYLARSIAVMTRPASANDGRTIYIRSGRVTIRLGRARYRRPSTPTKVERSNWLLRRNGAEGLFAGSRYLVPVDFAIEPDSDPATCPYIGRPEEAVRLGCDEFCLNSRECGTPQMWEVVIVVAIGP